MSHDTPVMGPLGRIVAKSTDVAPASVPQGVVDLGLSKGKALVLHDAQMVRLDGKHGKVIVLEAIFLWPIGYHS